MRPLPLSRPCPVGCSPGMVLEVSPHVLGVVPEARYRCQDCDRVQVVSTGHARRDQSTGRAILYRLSVGFLKVIHASIWESQIETSQVETGPERDGRRFADERYLGLPTGTRNPDSTTGLDDRTRNMDSNNGLD